MTWTLFLSLFHSLSLPFILFSWFSLFLSHISLTNEAVHTTPTIGSNVEEISVKKTRFLVWDIGGQEALRASWNTYYCNTEVSK